MDKNSKEYLESKHTKLAEQIDKLEEQRELDRSGDTKIKIQSLKKEKLLIKDKLEALK